MPTCPNCQGYVPLGEKECPKCGLQTDFDELAREERAKRDSTYRHEQADAAEREAEIQRIQVTTMGSVLGCKLAADLGIIGADIVEYASGFDLAATIENKLGQMREAATRRLREKAHTLGGDAVVSVSFSFDALEATGLWIVLSATGTAVTLAFEEQSQ